MYHDVELWTESQTAAFVLAIERDPKSISKNVKKLKFSLGAARDRLRCEHI